jgi:hypothetical protein
MKISIRYLALAGIILFLNQPSLAVDVTDSNEFQFDDYIVYYNTYPSVFLQPHIASAVGINRSDTRDVLTIAVKKKQAGLPEQAVKAHITGTVITLMGHVRNISMREVKDGDAIYYVADFTVLERENLTFKISIQPEGALNPEQVEFKRGFYSRY